jgi:hypothetical protein
MHSVWGCLSDKRQVEVGAGVEAQGSLLRTTYVDRNGIYFVCQGGISAILSYALTIDTFQMTVDKIPSRRKGFGWGKIHA